MLAHAVRTQGWTFIPSQVIPPLLANTAISAVCYATYLQALAALDPPSSGALKRVYPPPPFSTTFTAGAAAGAAQSLVAAPFDALQVRFRASELLHGKYSNMWSYAYHKLRAIGLRGIFAGSSLSLCKDSAGYGLFFGTFEFVKSQCFYTFVSQYYGSFGTLSAAKQDLIRSQQTAESSDLIPTIEPHYMIEPIFIMAAGVAASFAQQLVQYPLSRVQDVHHGRLAGIDTGLMDGRSAARSSALHLYQRAYGKTFRRVVVSARRSFRTGPAGLMFWLYSGMLSSTLRQVPSASVGLMAFEVIRRKYALEADVVRIHIESGYDILLA
ncbi:hypothetical protein B0A48_13109 [Cryoendolithus antarcticus]|uniref:Mitochondrial thiamine pyrophosphate carrier 1 n=1 Tax=Cryoendolithus antarcticus TaxID=1507870 RepID=A0A1V8SNC6_9PEZI|nr:hypothetical protein B0A48_13109 [Cryoendolithus antarcticus]